jgi:cell division septation protein DedD
MHGVFDDEDELQPVEHRRDPRDTEVTLGPMRLVGLLCGLIFVCGLCFGLGYVVGRHKGQQPPPDTTAQPADAAQTTPPAIAAPPKPSAAPPSAPAPAPAQQPAADDSANPSDENPSETNPATAPQFANPADSGSGSFSGAAVVHPALPQIMQSSPQWMVEIAAVAQREDAQVLAGALRRRGYAVSFRFDPADGLIHVRIGPLSSLREANLMRQRLLNDGYNAIVQP